MTPQLNTQVQLSASEMLRYDRHLRLAGFGAQKQLRLKQSKVLLVGAGGLGCPIGLYLAASGVGTLGIADGDNVEVSNLQRQVAFSQDEIGENKAIALAKTLSALNPLIEISNYSIRINAMNVESLIKNYHLVIDGTDNFATRFLLADACYLNNISYLHASVHQYQGQISLFVPGKTPCFRCLFRQPPTSSALPDCAEAGILGVVTGSVGLIAAVEAVKYLAEIGASTGGQVIIYDALKQELKKMKLEYDQNCPLCSGKATITEIETRDATGHDHASCADRLAMQEYVITIADAAELMKAKSSSKHMLLLDVREDYEYAQGHLAGAISWPLSILQSIPDLAVKAELKSKLSRAIDFNDRQAQTILCYCQRGVRSLQAVQLLHQAGLTNVFSLEGGLEGWQTYNLSPINLMTSQ